jgi:hypothetical protein
MQEEVCWDKLGSCKLQLWGYQGGVLMEVGGVVGWDMGRRSKLETGSGGGL